MFRPATVVGDGVSLEVDGDGQFLQVLQRSVAQSGLDFLERADRAPVQNSVPARPSRNWRPRYSAAASSRVKFSAGGPPASVMIQCLRPCSPTRSAVGKASRRSNVRSRLTVFSETPASAASSDNVTPCRLAERIRKMDHWRRSYTESGIGVDPEEVVSHASARCPLTHPEYV